MDQPNELLAGVVKYGTVVAGVLGSVVSLSYTQELTKFRAFTAVAGGAATAVYTAPLICHYLSLPSFENAVAFLVGLAAMRAIPALLGAVDRLKDIKLPWGG